MKKLLFGMVCSLVFCGTTLAADGKIEKLLKEPFLKASFEKQRKLKILSKPFVTRGIILFHPEKGVVWQTRQPLMDTLIILNNGEIRSLNPQQDAAMRANPVIASVSNIFLTLLSLDLEKIKMLFDVKAGEVKNDFYEYYLVPKDELLAGVIDKIVLSGKIRMESINIYEKSGDQTTVKFANEIFDNSSLDATDMELLELLK